MIDQQIYVKAKLRELDAADRTPALRERLAKEQPRKRGRTPVRPIIAGAGRRVRRLGEALEAWGVR